MEKTLLLEEIIFLLASIILIFLASRTNIGLKRSIYLIFAWLSSVTLSIFIILVLINDGLAPEEIILSVYSFAILLGLMIHLVVNQKRKLAVNQPKVYSINSNLNSKLEKAG